MGNEQSYEVLDVRLSTLETNTKNLEIKIEELLNVLNQLKGFINALKLIFYITAPIVGVVYWVKDHIKL